MHQVTEDVETAFLQGVDEGYQTHRRARIADHQENLRPPELDVILLRIQQQQVLSHLHKIKLI